jgi:hypothetical protein
MSPFTSIRRLAGLAAAMALVLGCDSVTPAGDGKYVCRYCTKKPQDRPGLPLFGLLTPCQQSETATPVDAQSARTLGFGATLDLLERDLESPFEWIARETPNGAPATGYQPATTVRVRTRVAALQHRVPSLAGCQDSVVATLAATLATADGALETEGQLVANVTHDEPAPTASGSFDLAGARGSLMLYPDGSGWPLWGGVGLGLRFWPDGARGHLSIVMGRPGEYGSDSLTFGYWPIEGRWPVDDCGYDERPMAPDEPGATPGGRSPAQLVTELQGMLDAGPRNGIWAPSGAQATVTTRLGPPAKVCLISRPDLLAVNFRTQLQISTSDGLLQLNHEASGGAGFDASDRATSAGVGISNLELMPIPAQEFKAKTGIKGIDLGQARAANWRAHVSVVGGNFNAVNGQVIVNGVGVPGASEQDPLGMFHWP